MHDSKKITTEADVIELFDYKAMMPDDKIQKFNLIKEQGKCFALTIFRNTPAGDKQIEALTTVLRSCHLATAALSPIKKFEYGQPVEEQSDEI